MNDTLHQAIMNIPCKTPSHEHAYGAYERGHRDARHAAAELAMAELSRLRESLAEAVGACEAAAYRYDELVRRHGHTEFSESLFGAVNSMVAVIQKHKDSQ